MLTFEQYAPEIVSFAAKLLRNYLECNDVVQGGIREMIEIVNSTTQVAVKDEGLRQV